MPDKQAAGTVRVLLVDDQPEVRRGLRMRLELEPDMEVVGEASDGAEALDLARRTRPDVVLMDVEMPALDGVAAARSLREAAPRAAVVMLTIHDDRATRAAALAAGARGFVAKHRIDGDLLSTIREAAGGAHAAG